MIAPWAAVVRAERRILPRGGWWVALAVWFGSVGFAAEPVPRATNAADGRERDLGQGLLYYRMHALPDDLPPPERGRIPPCVIDLRYLRTDEAGVAAFAGWVAGRASARTPVFILANEETEAGLRRVGITAAGVFRIGIARGDFQPDIAVSATPQNERRAYDAFQAGATIASLLTDHPGKIRFDETTLGKDHRSGPGPRTVAVDRPGAEDGPPVDAVLQRAVHLHRGLVAMKKL